MLAIEEYLEIQFYELLLDLVLRVSHSCHNTWNTYDDVKQFVKSCRNNKITIEPLVDEQITNALIHPEIGVGLLSCTRGTCSSAVGTQALSITPSIYNKLIPSSTTPLILLLTTFANENWNVMINTPTIERIELSIGRDVFFTMCYYLHILRLNDIINLNSMLSCCQYYHIDGYSAIGAVSLSQASSKHKRLLVASLRNQGYYVTDNDRVAHQLHLQRAILHDHFQQAIVFFDNEFLIVDITKLIIMRMIAVSSVELSIL